MAFLKEQKALAKQNDSVFPSWNKQLIADIEANIRKTKDAIREVKRRL